MEGAEPDVHFWTVQGENQEEFRAGNGRRIYNKISETFSNPTDDIFKNRNGDWCIKTVSTNDFTTLTEIVDDEGGKTYKVETTENLRSITSTGECYHSSFRFESEEELINELKIKNERVIKAQKKTKYMGGIDVDTGIVIITFKGKVRPEKVKVFNLILDLEDHKPYPKRCTRCQDYRHTRKYCQAPPVCAKCAKDHFTSECKEARIKKCVNCDGEHYASSWDCPRYQEEQIVEAVREKYRLTYRQADSQIIANKKANRQPFTPRSGGAFAPGITPLGVSFPPVAGANPWNANRETGNTNNQINTLTAAMTSLKKTVEKQAEIISIQSRLLFLMISQGGHSAINKEVRQTLNYLGGLSTSDTDTDSDSDTPMEVTESDSADRKRKERGSVAESVGSDAGEQGFGKSGFQLPKKTQKRMDKRLKREGKEPPTIHTSLIPKAKPP